MRTKYSGVLIILAVLSIVIFAGVIQGSTCLLATDDNLGVADAIKSAMPLSFTGWWYELNLFGIGSGTLPINATWLSLSLMSPLLYINWIHALLIGVSSVALFVYLSKTSCSFVSAMVSIITSFWIGTNFAIIYAGHIAKFAVVMWAIISIIFTGIGGKRGGIEWYLLSGLSIGMMFVEQLDLALFFAITIGIYSLLLTVKYDSTNKIRIIIKLSATVMMALLVSVHGLLQGYKSSIEDVSSVQNESPAQKWDFITQWSWPPEESIDFIAAGYTGWRSGEPDGPYWGRMGMASGLMNFKLDNHYLGAIPLSFALVAVWWVLKKRKYELSGKDVDRRFEIRFWFIAALATLLLSFGKFTPLYRLVMEIPILSDIRAPVKWMQVFQVSVAILAAHGMTLLFARGEPNGGKASCVPNDAGVKS